MLVRDGRDAVISYYHWLCNFSDLSIDLDEFLRDGGGHTSKPPAQEWADFYDGWCSYLNSDSTCVVRFEDMRNNPLEEIQRFCAFLGVSRPVDSILAAIDECSYSSMRAKEKEAVSESNSGEAMIMRRGEVGEWRSVLQGESLERFDHQAGAVLARLGY